jgi:histidine triad (HIT) family protein
MYDINNIFAKIIRKEIPADVVFENDYVMVIKDKFPKAKTHILVLPKGEYIDIINFNENASQIEKDEFFKAAYYYLAKLNHGKLHFNYKKEGGQEVFHLHAHILSEGQL